MAFIPDETTKIPWEYHTRAKAFRDRVCQADHAVVVATKSIVDAAQKIIKRRRTFRSDHLLEFQKRWMKEIPDQYRLGMAMQRTKTSLTIGDCRLVSANFKKKSWDDHESSINIDILELFLNTGEVRYLPRILASASLHSIGRFYERSFIATEVQLLIDLSEVALQIKQLLHHRKWEVPVAGGVWRGDTLIGSTVNGRQKLLCIRTFV